MASNTPNLDLLKKDPVNDSNDTFNIQTMLNDNWDKVDTAVGNKVDKVTGKQLSAEDYTTVEKDKLGGIESGATADRTDAEIKTAYESNADTNVFTDVEKSKLAGIEASAEVNNLTDADASDLTDGTDSSLHFHLSDRSRSNHTGTQSASTISDFAAAVRSTVLTGLSTATNAAINAADTVLSALGRLQAQINNKSDIGHTHDSRYYTESEINGQMAGKIDTNDASTNNTANTIVKRDSSGNISVGNSIHFGNNDGFLYDDSNNVMNIVADDNNYKIWHSGNDGSGSGLDADKLDGLNASSFVRRNAAQTMAARLTAQNNSSYTTKQVRNITLSTSNPSGGANGDVWIKYS